LIPMGMRFEGEHDLRHLWVIDYGKSLFSIVSPEFEGRGCRAKRFELFDQSIFRPKPLGRESAPKEDDSSVVENSFSDWFPGSSWASLCATR
jgi:hypothetical protein